MFTIADLLIFTVPPAFSAVLLLALHWFPWNGGGRELTRIQAYTIGTSILILVPSAAAVLGHALGYEYPAPAWAGLYIANALAGGLAVLFAYWVDSHRALGRDDAR